MQSGTKEVSKAQAKLDEGVRYSAITFRYLLNSMARPGKIHVLEYPQFLGEPPRYHVPSLATAMPINMYALGAMMTLLDKEVTFTIAANGRWLEQHTPIVRWIAVRSGSRSAMPDSATFALFCDGNSNGLLAQLHMGMLLEPEASATAFYCVERLASGSELIDDVEQSKKRLLLTLTGPGIADKQSIAVVGLDGEAMNEINAARQGYPLGIDAYVIDAVGRCVGLPRTTKISKG